MSVLARPRLRRLPLAAALTGFAALAIALLLGPGATPVPSAAVGALAALLLLAEIVRRGRELWRSGLAHQVALAMLGTSIVAAAWSLTVAAHLEYFGLAFVVGLGGAALITLSLLRVAAEVDGGHTPWQALAGGATAAASARARFQRLAPLLAGILAVLVALRLLALGITGAVGSSPSGALIVTLVMLAVFVIGPGWALRGLYERVRTAGQPSTVARDERVVAAHLHDSVLQTLALIQRSSSDPARMAQLARQQERGLRDWLAGRDGEASTTLAGAIRRMAEAVEDEEPGAVIEVLAVGDAPLDERAHAMTHAAREAMRNAARHASNGTIEVFLEIQVDGTRQLYVRDSGGGFDLDAVGAERRGVRDAIIGRMEHAGGTAAIESGPNGTEVALRLAPIEGDASQ